MYKKRLRDNDVTFNDDAKETIIKVTGMHPRKIILLSNKVYELARANPDKKADDDTVYRAFIEVFSNEVHRAQESKDKWPAGHKRIYCELSNLNCMISARDLANKMNTNIDKDLLNDFSSQIIQPSMDKLCDEMFAKKIAGGMYYVEPEVAYAMKLVLKGSLK